MIEIADPSCNEQAVPVASSVPRGKKIHLHEDVSKLPIHCAGQIIYIMQVDL